jgi:hypothetical protein
MVSLRKIRQRSDPVSQIGTLDARQGGREFQQPVKEITFNRRVKWRNSE